jgi:hypothetical protein
LKVCGTSLILIRSNANIGSVAQRLEQGTHNPLVLGSNPSVPSQRNKNPRHDCRGHQKSIALHRLLKRLFVHFTRSNPDHFGNWVKEYLAVPNFSGASCFDDGLDRFLCLLAFHG